jgi:hypothetical protein
MVTPALPGGKVDLYTVAPRGCTDRHATSLEDPIDTRLTPAPPTGAIVSLEAPAHCRADRFLAWAAALDEATPQPPQPRPPDTEALAPERRRAEQLATRAPLLLQLACDASCTDGRIEVRSADGQRADLRWDLSQPLPLPPGSVDSIFHEHLLDRLGYAQGIELHRRCLAVLRPGGVLRIRVADAGAALQDYAANVGGETDEWPMAMARVACLTANPARRSLYDAETLELSCLAAGFPRADQLDFAEGDEPCLYVEATA